MPYKDPQVAKKKRSEYHAANAIKRRTAAKKWSAEHYEQYLRNKRASWARHKARLNEARREARKADPDKFRALEKRSKSRPEVRALKLERDRLKYVLNREAHIAYVKEYQKTNAEKLAPYKKLRGINRRARNANACGSCSVLQWKQRYLFYGGRCAYCWLELDFSEAQMDHVKALARGGSNWASNIVPACGPCNVSKNAAVWLPEMYGFTTKASGDKPPKLASKDSGTRPTVTES
jgi:5-methylcytosine-specific restriction endonuclease McrA